MIELRHIRAFVAIAEELHFGRAARRLHMTQPPLSQLLKQLEASVGVQLVKRTTRSVELTPAGRTYLERAKAVLATVATAPDEARRAAHGEIGRLVIGFTPSAAYQFLAPMIRAYRRAYPHTDLHFREMVSVRQLDALRRSEIDIALLRPPVDGRDIQRRIILREAFVAAIPHDHPLARKRSVHPRDLDQQKFVAFDADESPYFFQKVQELTAAYDAKPQIVQRAVLPTMLTFVAARVGVALVPQSATRLTLRGIVFRPVAVRGREHTAELAAAWSKDDQNILIRNWLSAVRSRP